MGTHVGRVGPNVHEGASGDGSVAYGFQPLIALYLGPTFSTKPRFTRSWTTDQLT